MPCFCSAQLSSLLPKLSGLPSLAGLVPPLPPLLLPAISLPILPVGPAAATASAGANASLAANMAVMASLKADVHAAMGMNLMASLSGPPLASLQASFAQTIGSMNANANLLLPYQDLLSRLLQELANLMRLANVVTAVQARFGINLRAAGAVPLLQARMTAMAQASARASATAHASAMASMMAALGLALTPAGASALGVSMQALARVGMAAPPLTVNLNPLSLLSALLAMLQAIRNALGVNMLAVNAMATLRATLGALPLSALASLQAHASAMASATAAASASASAAMPALNFRAAARANMIPASRLALAMRVATHANMLMLPAGQCGKPCPVEAVKVFT